MGEVEVSAGVLEVEDTGGSAPVVVLLHGLLMAGSVWARVVEDLRADHRCVVPTLPMGAHLRPMRPDSDLSPSAMAGLVGELLERMDLREVTLVENDTGLAQLFVTQHPDRAERVARLVLASCEAFDNYPPGLPGKAAMLFGHLPGGLWITAHVLHLRALRRLPFTFGWLTKRPVPEEVFERWNRPLRTDPRVRRDVRAYIRGVDRRAFLVAAERLRSFDRPALVAWAAEDRVMPPEHGPRLAGLLPQGRLVEIPDSRTVIPMDQPAALAEAIRTFVRQTKTERQIRMATVGEPARLDGPVTLAEYDPAWPDLFEREAGRIRTALGDRVLRVEHVGSTAVPGLAAKPIVDVLLVVADPAAEDAYVLPLEDAGYILRIREPDWYEHRLFKGPDTDVNLHVLPEGCPESDRMLAFRDRLRSDPGDRQRYERAKRDLAGRTWRFVQDYADAKSEVVEDILSRAGTTPSAQM